MVKELTTHKATVALYSDPFNKRIRIDNYVGDLSEVLAIIKGEVSAWVEKLIVKSRVSDVPFFMANGFACEAFVKGYFSGDDMYFVSKYFSAQRERREKWEEEQSIIEKLILEKRRMDVPELEGIRIATLSQAGALAHLYKEVFKMYPTPLGDENHIRKTMEEGTVYAYIESNGNVVSAASAEINQQFNNAELTDCATLPQAEGMGHMKKLLYFIEQRMKVAGMTCFYSIARAESFSMNKAFAQLGYAYGGRLVKNCFICSGLEDMNVWYKSAP